MIGIEVAAKVEWMATLSHFNKTLEDSTVFPFGEYFYETLKGQKIIFFRSGVRKVLSSAATQYMIDNFNLTKIIVIGTCAGIDDNYKNLDIFIPNKAVQYDCTIKEIYPLIMKSFIVDFDLSNIKFKFNTGTIGTADKAVVMWKDYLELKNNNITIADTESAAIAYICRMNNIDCLIIKGISDFPSQDSSQEEDLERQTNTFIKNVPIIINTILDDYLPKVI